MVRESHVGYSDGFIEVDSGRVFLFCGEIHYFRVPKNLWFDRLLKTRRAGLNCIASYIPWNWHEPIENHIIFGDEHPLSPYESNVFSRDLASYIDLIKKLDMFFIARPGPYICSEWDSGGHPNWLYTKTSILRSLDTEYIRYSEKWYSTILPIIERYTYPRGGPILLLQIENEYFWGDTQYLIKLHEIARRYIKDIPIITNEDWYVEKTPIINTIDDYPLPWNIQRFDDKVRKYIVTQPGKPKIFMELEGGWFSTLGAPLPTNRGSFPAEWTETLIKTAIGMGINGISIYMFHGGTNPGYYTGKYITTTYDYEAAIREWGELSQRYYAIKRVALFTKTFNSLIASTKPVDGIVRVSRGIDVFTRVGDNGEAIVVLRNLSESIQYIKIFYRDSYYPSINTITIPPKKTKVVILNYSISGTPFKILYTSSEPLIIKTIGSETMVVLYGDSLELGEVGIEASEDIEVEFADGITISRLDNRKIVIDYIHDSSDKIAAIKSGVNKLYIIAISRARADRTWYIDDIEPPIILISNIYFVGRVSTADGKTLIELELDENSSGYITLISFKPLSNAVVAGRKIPLKHVYGPIYRLYINSHRITKGRTSTSIDSIWRYAVEPSMQGGDVVEVGKSLEQLNMLFNGYTLYTIEFDIDKKLLDSLKNRDIYINYFNDYITAILNGVSIASGYHSIEADASNLLREGKNKLDIILESTGHPNDGLVYIPNGIVGNVYIGKISEESLTNWLYIEYTPRYGEEFSMSRFLNSPKEIEELLLDVERRRKAVYVDTISSPGIYIRSIYIDKKVGRYILDLGRAIYNNYYLGTLLFINRKFVGVYKGPIDITNYITEGENEIVIVIIRTLSLAPTLKRYQHAVDGVWKVRGCTEGLINNWYRESYDDSRWEVVELPLHIENSMGRVIWLRGKAYIGYDEDIIAPLKMVIRASGVRTLLYFNGQFIGRFVDEGPQTEFYIPEPLIRKGVNEIAIMIHITSNHAYIDSISIEPYYIHIKTYIELS